MLNNIKSKYREQNSCKQKEKLIQIYNCIWRPNKKIKSVTDHVNKI